MLSVLGIKSEIVVFNEAKTYCWTIVSLCVWCGAVRRQLNKTRPRRRKSAKEMSGTCCCCLPFSLLPFCLFSHIPALMSSRTCNGQHHSRSWTVLKHTHDDNGKWISVTIFYIFGVNYIYVRVFVKFISNTHPTSRVDRLRFLSFSVVQPPQPSRHKKAWETRASGKAEEDFPKQASVIRLFLSCYKHACFVFSRVRMFWYIVSGCGL